MVIDGIDKIVAVAIIKEINKTFLFQNFQKWGKIINSWLPWQLE